MEKRKELFDNLLAYINHLYENSKDNKFVSFIKKLQPNNSDAIVFLKNLKTYLSNIKEDQTNYIVCKLLDMVQNDYLTNVNGRITTNNTGITSFNVDSMNKIQANNNNGNCDGIITREGTFYPSKDFYSSLVINLCLVGVPLKGAVRVTEQSAYGTISFSSLHSYKKVNREFGNELTISITPEQAKTMIDYYCAHYQTQSCSLTEILKSSENLGWIYTPFNWPNLEYYDDEKTKNNIEKLKIALQTKLSLNENSPVLLELNNLINIFLLENNKNRKIH